MLQSITKNIYWEPDLVNNLKKLEWITSSIGRGIRHGKHPSQTLGFHAEFKQFSQFKEGEDARYLDWKIYARTKKKFVKQYHSESATSTLFLIDTSLSMDFKSKNSLPSKFEFSLAIIAVLAKIFDSQKDKIGFSHFISEDSTHLVPPQQNSLTYKNLLTEINQMYCSNTKTCNELIIQSLESLSPRTNILLFSDFMEDLDHLKKALSKLSGITKEISLIQILDPIESSIETPNSSVILQSIEDKAQFIFDPKKDSKSYLDQFHSHQKKLLKVCNQTGSRFHSMQSNDPLNNGILYLLSNCKKK